MTLRRYPLASTPAARASVVLSLLALTGLGIATANTEAVVTGRFAAALEQSAPRQETAALEAPGTLVAGTEAYWLAEKRRHEAGDATLEPAAWSAPIAASDLSVGDRITISSRKAERVLEVVAVSDVAQAKGGEIVAASGQLGRQIAVTCRDVNAPNGRLTTFIVPVGISGVTKSARVL